MQYIYLTHTFEVQDIEEYILQQGDSYLMDNNNAVKRLIGISRGLGPFGLGGYKQNHLALAGRDRFS